MKKIFLLIIFFVVFFASVVLVKSADLQQFEGTISSFVGCPVGVQQIEKDIFILSLGSFKITERFIEKTREAIISDGVAMACVPQQATLKLLRQKCREQKKISVAPVPTSKVPTRRVSLLGTYSPDNDPLLRQGFGTIGRLQGPEIAAQWGRTVIGAASVLGGAAIMADAVKDAARITAAGNVTAAKARRPDMTDIILSNDNHSNASATADVLANQEQWQDQVQEMTPEMTPVFNFPRPGGTPALPPLTPHFPGIGSTPINPFQGGAGTFIPPSAGGTPTFPGTGGVPIIP